MRVVKSSIAILTAMLLTGTTLAATSSQAPASVVPISPKLSPKSKPLITTEPVNAKPVKAPNLTSVTVPKPTQVYADAAPGQPGATTQAVIPADINTDVAYASMLPKGAEVVPGDPTKNEFFIVAAEDATKIKQLLDRTKPGREIAVADIKSKHPILKVKLDENNATLVSMDVVSSVKTVAKQAMKPSVHMTETDEVMSIYTKNHITPMGSRVAATVVPKPTLAHDEVEEKPMLKLLASHGNSAAAEPVAQATLNPLQATSAVKPDTKIVMPDTATIKQTIEQPAQKPVELPLASKGTAPTLEMVLQQASDNKIKGTATVLTTAAHNVDKAKKVAVVSSTKKTKSDTAKRVATKPSITKTAAPKATIAKVLAHTKTETKPAIKVSTKITNVKTASADTTLIATKVSATNVSTKKVAAAKTKKLVTGKTISYEQAIPAKKKAVAWNARHAAEATKSQKVIAKKAVKKAGSVGVVHNYSDYLAQTE